LVLVVLKWLTFGSASAGLATLAPADSASSTDQGSNFGIIPAPPVRGYRTLPCGTCRRLYRSRVGAPATRAFGAPTFQIALPALRAAAGACGSIPVSGGGRAQERWFAT